MELSVLGSAQAIPAAVYAAANSGRTISVTSPALEAKPPRDAALNGKTVPITVVEGLAPESELFLIVAESAQLKDILHRSRHQLAGRNILLAPGGFSGALRATEWFRQWQLPMPAIAEAPGFIAGGKPGGETYEISTIKRQLPIAGIDQATTLDILAKFRPYFPDLAASDLATTSLSNTNHMIHPAVVLLNAVRIENGESFRFYREGISPAVASLIEGVDQERREIVRALGAQDLSLSEWMTRFYGDQGMRGDNIVQCLQGFPAFESTPAPTSLRYRYLTDDVPFGIAQYFALAQRLGTPSRNLQSLVSSVSLLSPETNLEADGPSAQLFNNYLLQCSGVKA